LIVEVSAALILCLTKHELLERISFPYNEKRQLDMSRRFSIL
tara:strand:+ start:22180 stop:22305 length:126 start_codon:yes stop_codon:yes gene_type:complete